MGCVYCDLHCSTHHVLWYVLLWRATIRRAQFVGVELQIQNRFTKFLSFLSRTNRSKWMDSIVLWILDCILVHASNTSQHLYTLLYVQIPVPALSPVWLVAGIAKPPQCPPYCGEERDSSQPRADG